MAKKKLSKVESALQKAHLFKWEIEELTATKRKMKDGRVLDVKPIDLTGPVVKNFIRERAKAFREAQYMARVKRPIWQSQKQADQQAFYKFREQVYQKYLDNNWISDRPEDKDNFDFWKMLRGIEEEYKKDNPDYADSPRKKQKGSHHKTKLDKGNVRAQKERNTIRGQIQNLGISPMKPGQTITMSRNKAGNVIGAVTKDASGKIIKSVVFDEERRQYLQKAGF